MRTTITASDSSDKSSLFNLNIDVLACVIDSLHQPDLRHMALTCHVVYDLCRPYFYKCIKIKGMPKAIAFAEFLETEEGMKWHPTIRSLVFDIQNAVSALHATGTFDSSIHRAKFILCTRKLLNILTGARFLTHLEILDHGECLAQDPRLMDIIVSMPHLTEFAVARSDYGTCLLRRMKQPLSSLHIAKPRNPLLELSHPALDYPSHSLADVSQFSYSLESMELEESYLSRISVAGVFPRLKSLDLSFIEGAPQDIVKWSHIRKTFPEIRYITYLMVPGTAIPEEYMHDSSTHLMANSAGDATPVLVIRTDDRGLRRIERIRYVRELFLKGNISHLHSPDPSHLTRCIADLSPLLLSIEDARPWGLRHWLAELMGEAYSLRAVFFGIPAMPGQNVGQFVRLQKERLSILADLLRGMPITGMNLRVHQLGWNAAEKAVRFPGYDAFESFALRLFRAIPCLEHFNMYIIGMEGHQPISWATKIRGSQLAIRRVTEEEGHTWSRERLREFSDWAQEPRQVELILDPNRSLGREATARILRAMRSG